MSISSISGSMGYSPTQMAADFFKKADSNGDGSIDKSELKTMLSKGPNGKNLTDADVDKIFSEIDSNGDGKIDQTENADQMKKMSGGKGGPPPAGGTPPSGGAPKSASASGGSSSSGAKVYDKRDANKDGSVSYQERLDYDLKHPEEAKDSSAAGASSATQSGVAYDNEGIASAAASPAQGSLDISA
jgi:EF-hand domain pair